MTSPDTNDPWLALATELGVPAEQGAQEKSPADPLHIDATTTAGDFLEELEARGIHTYPDTVADPERDRGIVLRLRAHGKKTQPLLAVLPDFGFTPQQFREWMSSCVQVIFDGTPETTDPHDATPSIEIHPTTSIFDFRNRVAALGIPLSTINHPVARAIDQYQGPKYGSANTSLLGFLHQRGFTLQQLQEALQLVVPVVQGKKPFGRRPHHHRKAL